MNVGKKLCNVIIDDVMDGLTNELHNIKCERIDSEVEYSCDVILYDIVTDIIEQFNSNGLTNIILF